MSTHENAHDDDTFHSHASNIRTIPVDRLAVGDHIFREATLCGPRITAVGVFMDRITYETVNGGEGSLRRGGRVTVCEHESVYGDTAWR